MEVCVDPLRFDVVMVVRGPPSGVINVIYGV